MVNVSSNTINKNQNRVENKAISFVNSFECYFKMVLPCSGPIFFAAALIKAIV